MKFIKGDLIELALNGIFDVIIHGCNCQCAMGAGIAKLIRTKFPEAFEVDLQTQKGDRRKLGTISIATVILNNHEITIINAYTQFNWRGSGILADYEAIRRAMLKIKSLYGGRRIGYPMIGAGLAGGDWGTIARIICEELEGEDHTLVEYVPSGV
ncbi:MAG: macro domain-containing protein [Planctomycetaceae bacterium]